VQAFSETFFILRRIEGDMIINYIGLHVKYPLFLSDFNETWNFLSEFRKIHNIKFHKNPSSGSVLFHADGRTDVTKFFRNFANAPKNVRCKWHTSPSDTHFTFGHTFCTSWEICFEYLTYKMKC